MKKVIIAGVGAQGSTIAKRLNDDENVGAIICADYDRKAAEELGKTLEKATALELDAGRVENVIEAARGCDIIINGLPLEYDLIVMEAALAVNAAYMDLAGPIIEEIGFVESYKLIFTEWNDRFKEKGLTALVGAGSTPGMANIMARESVDRMDACDKIGIYVYDGVWTNRFTPFWWSPEVALGDMGYVTFRCENGDIITDEPFSRPEMMTFKGVPRPVRMVDHEHDEPVTMGLLKDKVLKGVKHVEFKYGGPSVDLSENLYRMGLLGLEPVKVKGVPVVPMDLVLKLTPPAPKYPEEIKAIIDQGLEMEEGAFLVRVQGKKDGRDVCIDSYLCAPGLVEAFEASQLSHESYSTGQCAAVFAKMMVNDVLTEKGLFSPEQLEAEQRAYCFRELAGMGVTIDEIVETRRY
ncbi:MAG: saccharopine dehydrogenase NADP-binding domain-containing protein [Deltaproteobacteria bacterium]|jgi:saccharopine dehydrogenase (NAD+, L-lysine forming)|nr:saccharopine dehydrogenase NADP-binding domain-containing protein [Deltaproteobacteria bacterium]